MSNMSMPCIFPKISKRSRPVACSRSVGIVPGAAPGGRRSDSAWISIVSNSDQRGVLPEIVRQAFAKELNSGKLSVG